ncbi:XRE family transcriptional regulator [Micromonospora sp. CPCC 206061]|uniref:XRE family transcriptional regulator n=1 Tax=Micromonospora sp. CPCC 206061 TaxID=3122410 RepID=UPI002FF0C377
MANERLRAAMDRAGVSVTELATYTENDAKTVGRWLGGRVPHPRTRFKVAKRLREDEEFLWPGANRPASGDSDAAGIVQFYANRGLIPPTLWDRLFEQATVEIGILVYVGMFLTEKPKLLPQLRAKAQAGTRIRLIFGEVGCPAVIQRSTDENIGRNTISAKIEHALSYFKLLDGQPGVEIRTHDTVLYNSIYIFDRDMIVNPHVYGKTAPHAPALHLRRTGLDDPFDTYASSFEHVWQTAKPAFT